MTMLRAMPILQVGDVMASIQFYVRLGFAPHGIWGDPPGFCIVQRGEVTLGLAHAQAGDIKPNQQWAAYLYVADVEALHREFSALDGVVVSAIEDQPYGCRDFDVRDLDGHVLAFGQDMAPETHGPGLGPDRGAN